MNARTSSGQFAPGHSGNPAGRRPRDVSLRTSVTDAFRADWFENGAAAVASLREKDLATYLRLATRICAMEDPLDYITPPKEVTVRIIEPNGRNVSLEEYRGEPAPACSEPANPSYQTRRVYD